MVEGGALGKGLKSELWPKRHFLARARTMTARPELGGRKGARGEPSLCRRGGTREAAADGALAVALCGCPVPFTTGPSICRRPLALT